MTAQTHPRKLFNRRVSILFFFGVESHVSSQLPAQRIHLRDALIRSQAQHPHAQVPIPCNEATSPFQSGTSVNLSFCFNMSKWGKRRMEEQLKEVYDEAMTRVSKPTVLGPPRMSRVQFQSSRNHPNPPRSSDANLQVSEAAASTYTIVAMIAGFPVGRIPALFCFCTAVSRSVEICAEQQRADGHLCGANRPPEYLSHM
ncbi:hypothetical protein A0H81_11186 [Grifola frondosa]|uniref:Uncharacterized protein n=1 Tax=Grifola frondosa TaxID=5627 RepID=A0A1C7M118_GRIFR|nr:hypothetical protein A0H81_11186 [Grifola frondosa]